MDLTLTPWQRDNYERALRTAPTVLENLFWGWLLGYPGARRIYFEELEITCLDDGPGGEPDNFRGDGSAPY